MSEQAPHTELPPQQPIGAGMDQGADFDQEAQARYLHEKAMFDKGQEQLGQALDQAFEPGNEESYNEWRSYLDSRPASSEDDKSDALREKHYESTLEETRSNLKEKTFDDVFDEINEAFVAGDKTKIQDLGSAFRAKANQIDPAELSRAMGRAELNNNKDMIELLKPVLKSKVEALVKAQSSDREEVPEDDQSERRKNIQERLNRVKELEKARLLKGESSSEAKSNPLPIRKPKETVATVGSNTEPEQPKVDLTKPVDPEAGPLPIIPLPGLPKAETSVALLPKRPKPADTVPGEGLSPDESKELEAKLEATETDKPVDSEDLYAKFGDKGYEVDELGKSTAELDEEFLDIMTLFDKQSKSFRNLFSTRKSRNTLAKAEELHAQINERDDLLDSTNDIYSETTDNRFDRLKSRIGSVVERFAAREKLASAKSTIGDLGRFALGVKPLETNGQGVDRDIVGIRFDDSEGDNYEQQLGSFRSRVVEGANQLSRQSSDSESGLPPAEKVIEGDRGMLESQLEKMKSVEGTVLYDQVRVDEINALLGKLGQEEVEEPESATKPLVSRGRTAVPTRNSFVGTIRSGAARAAGLQASGRQSQLRKSIR